MRTLVDKAYSVYSWLWHLVQNLTYVFLNACSSARTNVYPTDEKMISLNFYEVLITYVEKRSTENKYQYILVAD